MAVAVALVPGVAGAQTGSAPRFPEPSEGTPLAGTPAVALLASAALPGAGQYLLGAGRWVPYVALEAWGWTSFFRHRRDHAAWEQRYRELARDVARRASTEPERDGWFEYYEAMEYWSASGSFDVEPRRDGVQPEIDRQTYNGHQWALAQAIHLPATGSYLPGSPEYAAALAYYEERAIRSEYEWAWGDNDLEQKLFGDLIGRSDRSSRAATRALGLILANHVISAVDALIASRLQTGDARLRLDGAYDAGIDGFRFQARVRVR